MVTPPRLVDAVTADAVTVRGYRPAVFSHERTIPVIGALAPVLPEGALRRGQVVVSQGVAETSLVLALAAESTRLGSWLAYVEDPGKFELGGDAAIELGVSLERTVVVSIPRCAHASAAEVVAALIEGFDIVIVSAAVRFPVGPARKLQARLRTRGGALLVVGGSGSWEPDLVLRSVPATADGGWQISDEGGRFTRRDILIDVLGRRRGAAQRHRLWLPGQDGAAIATDPTVVESSARTVSPVASAG